MTIRMLVRQWVLMDARIDRSSGSAPGVERAAALSPSPSRSRRWRPLCHAGDIARDGQHWRTAARFYRWHLRLNPRDTAVWAQLGQMFEQAGHPAEAADAYARALKLDAGDPDLLTSYGRLCQLLGRVDDAGLAYPLSVMLDDGLHSSETPQQPGAADSAADKAQAAQLSAGDMAREHRAWRLAAEHYRAYLRLNPAAFEIWVRFGHMLQQSEQYVEAARAYDTARRLDPDDADLLLKLAELSGLTTARR
jgi:cytochrome c-type biogenesis protein CcmH/NrfG